MNGGTESPDPKEGENMSKWIYQVTKQLPGAPAAEPMATHPDGSAWTHESAIDWVHMTEHEAGACVWIVRGRSLPVSRNWYTHRVYIVQPDGRPKRTAG